MSLRKERFDYAILATPGLAQRTLRKSRGGEDGVVEPFFAQAHDQSETIDVDRHDGTLIAAVFSFFVGVDGIHSGIPGQNRFVVRVYQRRDVRVRKALPQRRNERRGARKIADVVTSNNQAAWVRVLRFRREWIGGHFLFTLKPNNLLSHHFFVILSRFFRALLGYARNT